ncbi:aldo/keto reductase [Salinibacterium sp. UTAS2018]|nr:aldo/keto reductase [Salinibacterium sp. UTAS2018]
MTAVGIGTSAIGDMPGAHGYSVDEERAAAALDDALSGSFNFVDTGANYGAGRSEQRLAASIARVSPAGLVIATKVDRDMTTGYFGGDQVLRSAEESLERLGVDSVPLLHLHDPETMDFDDAMAPGGPVAALRSLRDQGIAQHIGVAGGPASLMKRYVETGEFEVLQTHNRFTLLDRTADELLDAAASRGMGIINAAPYGGGMLSDAPRGTTRYSYRDASSATIAASQKMREVAAAHGISLAAAALQLSLDDLRIHCTVVGMSTPGRAASTLALADTPIPADVFAELRSLTPSRDEWLND